jgi:hypothetical protein
MVVGVTLGAPGVTVGPAVMVDGDLDPRGNAVGLMVVGLILGLPGDTVGTVLVRVATVGWTVEGFTVGLPGGTVGPAVPGVKVTDCL